MICEATGPLDSSYITLATMKRPMCNLKIGSRKRALEIFRTPCARSLSAFTENVQRAEGSRFSKLSMELEKGSAVNNILTFFFKGSSYAKKNRI
jgi:hypothetical protein